MGQPITCDYQGADPHLADTLVSRIENGETMAWCDAHYIAVCRAIVEAVEQAEADATDADALARLGDVESADPPTSATSSDAADPQAEPPTNGAGGPEGPEVDAGTTGSPDGAPEPPSGAQEGETEATAEV